MKPATFSLVLLIVGIAAAFTAGAAPILRGTLHYPVLSVTAQSMRMDFFSHGLRNSRECSASLERQVAALHKSCPSCAVADKRCTTAPGNKFFKALSEQPLAAPSSRYAEGVIVYSSATDGLALAVCRGSEQQTAQAAPGKRLRCFAPGTVRRRSDAP